MGLYRQLLAVTWTKVKAMVHSILSEIKQINNKMIVLSEFNQAIGITGSTTRIQA
ncbi:MAG: hypothetical protein ABF498_02080 [Liquorilactobacillus satsumensis]|uniref:hypothetical protein n=1 Tax=Liquorilactobacillus satsumensis TaxID=259059 RepID=UPI0039EBB694